MQIRVENIKCGGCASSITKKLQETFDAIADVNVEEGIIDIDINESKRDEVAATLSKLGYPMKGFNSLGAKAKSFVSCAIGTVNNKIT
jgi:copper chaperone CopZ